MAIPYGPVDEAPVMVSHLGTGFMAQYRSMTAIGNGPTRRAAYYALMKDCEAWPQAARDMLYVMLYPHIPLRPGETDTSLGIYTR